MSVRRGNVKCNRIIHFRSKEVDKNGLLLSKVHPTIENYTNVNVCSNGPARWKPLSPMLLGPFFLEEKKIPIAWYPNGIHPGFVELNKNEQVAACTNFENCWQFSKVFDRDLDSNNVVQRSFFERRAHGFSDVKPHRRALPKKSGTPVAAYWNGLILTYLESRKIYCAGYASLIINTPAYFDLVNFIHSGNNVQIIGFDGQDVDITPELMRKLYRDPVRPFGHELVLCCLLTGLAPWEE
jgi:hypothetical protein